MIIHKFGGSHLISKDTFENFYQILSSTEGNSVVVISALGKTTRRLLEAAQNAENGHFDKAISIKDKLLSFTSTLSDSVIEHEELKRISQEEIEEFFGQIAKYLKNIHVLRELTPRIQDALLSFGERIALKLFSRFCEAKGLKFAEVDAGDIIITNENFTQANPLQEIISENINSKILPFLEKYPIILTQGFIGKTMKNDYSTMGFESSNMTALLFAKYLDAHEITIWTDVEGIFNVDPNIWTKAEQLPELSFTEAEKAAQFGNKLIYPKMIRRAAKNNMKITYKSVLNPEGRATVIHPHFYTKSKMITITNNISFLRVDLTEQNEINSRIFSRIMSPGDNFKFVSRFNDFAEIFTDDAKVENLLQENSIPHQDYTCITLINEDILNLYKVIVNYSDLFLNLDYKLYPVDEGTYHLFIRSSENKDLTAILNAIN
ncbi:MAG: hypothetical protein A2X64_02100 [Ignavibacteria bacterium GWF2_33_9]|nr:MAG: hypothetical protein A2X64_02100 [Ignavibacteria bacterium GWF2_33_9]